MKKILLICNESKTVINFRQELIKFLQNKNFEISVIVNDKQFVEKTKKLGVDVYVFSHNNHSINPFGILKLKHFYKKIINTVSPNIIFTFQLKPNLFGTFAAKRTKIPIINMVEGLGNPFMPKNTIGKVIRFFVSLMYKRAFKISKFAFFLNGDDKGMFVDLKIINQDKAIIINGIGIDTTVFTSKSDGGNSKRVVYLSRLLKNKGIIDYCEVARKIRSERKDIVFELYGSESELTKNDLMTYIENEDIKYGGYVENTKEILDDSRILVSTSYREGFPRIILEAMALSRPVVAFDCVGNKDAVVDNCTGFLIKNRDIGAMCDRIIQLIDDNELFREFSKNSREICVQKYDSKIINSFIYSKIEEVMKA